MKQAAAVALGAFSLLQFEAYANCEVGIFRRFGRIFSVKRYKGVLVLYDAASGPAGQRSGTLQSSPEELEPEKKEASVAFAMSVASYLLSFCIVCSLHLGQNFLISKRFV